MDSVNVTIVVGAALLGGLLPGPVTLAIIGTSLNQGRRRGLALAWGCTGGSMVWAVSAALGMGAVLAANQWLFDLLRYFGAGYLLWLGWKSARAAMKPRDMVPTDIGAVSYLTAWTKGALIHLGNPKAVIFWGSIFAIGLEPGAPPSAVGVIIALCLVINFLTVTSYALLFSIPGVMAGYARCRRWIEATFAAFFAGAALQLLRSRES